MSASIRRLWAEAMRPTIGSGYLWAVIGISHVMLGAALQGVLGASGAAARLVLTVVYWILKERGDLRRGGSLRDGIVDAALVGVGAFYSGPRWWPIAVIIAIAAGAIIKEARPTTAKNATR